MEVAARLTPASPDCAPGRAESISGRPPFRPGSMSEIELTLGQIAQLGEGDVEGVSGEGDLLPEEVATVDDLAPCPGRTPDCR